MISLELSVEYGNKHHYKIGLVLDGFCMHRCCSLLLAKGFIDRHAAACAPDVTVNAICTADGLSFLYAARERRVDKDSVALDILNVVAVLHR